MELGEVGIWWSRSWKAEDESVNVPAAMEDLGYSAFWGSGGFEPGLLPRFGKLLAATRNVVVASGIVSVWSTSPQEIAAQTSKLDEEHPGRFLLGLGASHAPLVETYTRPYSYMVSYLDALDAAGSALSKDRRILAALGPRMLALAGERTAGAHPYFVPVEHTAQARGVLGEGPLLAPEVTVVLEPDPAKARAVARRFVAGYLSLPNYTNNLRALGFEDDDLAGQGSDHLVDAIVGRGDAEAVADRVRAHLDAGADHVCIQVLPAVDGPFPFDDYRDLAGALKLHPR